ncbi:MAG: lipocalin-like domain-containing protein [Candidatus Pacebacteria bacterium]|nr:lipocalin-like domain-containing protein [Candidatus Paceibacterota bacterium]
MKNKTYKEKYKPVAFPRDEQKHDHIIEWWYFNGNLRDKRGRLFSYMDCFFAAKPDKVDIQFLKIPLKQIFFSHYFLSDNKKMSLKKVNPLCFLDDNSFAKPLLWINYDNSCLIQETKPFEYRIANEFIDLELKSEKVPLLLNKNGFLDFKVKTTYYYSLTRLKTKGMIKVNKKWIEVEGQSWMDHQWSQTPATDDDIWVWFSIQLDNNAEIVCFVYGDKIKTFHASLLDAQGRIETTDKVVFAETGVNYKSPDTGQVYKLGYKIEIPKFKAKLTVAPLKKEQEMIFGNINYWEGGVKIKGELKGKKVEGLGFGEITAKIKSKKLASSVWKKITSKSIWKNIQDLSNFSAKTIYFLNKEIINKKR